MAVSTTDSGRPRLLIIGLDGVPSEFLFHRFLPQMPTVRRLLERGVHATLRTTDPPISVPAWPVMFTGVDPGTLGLYGFRHRRPGAYTEMYIPGADELRAPTLWQVLSERGRRVGVVGMPPGFPPPAVNGFYISDFLTPPNAAATTFPPELRGQLEAEFGPYIYDVVFRSHQRGQLASELVAMTRQRWRVAEALYAQEPWDVFAVHEIGTDRLHHAFWKQIDSTHPEYVAENPNAHLAEEYYALLDGAIGRMVDRAPEGTRVMIVSDHGSMAMRGCFCINQWLEQRGYLVMRNPPRAPGTPLEAGDVDWKKTVAWAAGGYYARIFFNVRGREREGTVALADVARLRAQLTADLSRLVGPDGQRLPVRVLDPREIYASVEGAAPDLIVYLDELKVRAAGTMGHPQLFLRENDTGPDDAVHSFDGVFVLAGPGVEGPRTLPELEIRDVMPTALELLGEPIPSHVQGRPIGGLVSPARAPRIAATA